MFNDDATLVLNQLVEQIGMGQTLEKLRNICYDKQQELSKQENYGNMYHYWEENKRGLTLIMENDIDDIAIVKRP
jgi:hypothetical protein